MSAYRRTLRALALVGAVGALLLALVGQAPGANATTNYNLLIADNLGKRILITDFYGNIKWEFDNPLNNSDTYSGPLGVKWEPGNKILATFGTGVVGLIDAATKTFDWKFVGCSATNWLESPYDAEIMPDGKLAIATRYNEGGEVAVYDTQGCKIVWKYLLSNAHSVRLYDPGYQTSQATLLMGGWGQTAEAIYQSGVVTTSPTVVWSVPTEYTHDAMVIPNGNVITVEGYYIQEITRADSQVWKQSTPNEDRRIAVNPYGGYIFSVANANQIEFRDDNGNLLREFSQLSDGTSLHLPYGIQVVTWPDVTSPSPSPSSSPGTTATPSPTPSASASSSPSPSPTATPTATPTPTPTATPTATPTPTPSVTPTPTPASTATPSPTPTPTPSLLPTPSPTPTPPATPSPTPTPAFTATPSPTPSSSPTPSATVTPAPTVASTATPTPTPTPSVTPTPVASTTPTPTPTPGGVSGGTSTPTPTVTPSATPTGAPTATASPAPTIGHVVGPVSSSAPTGGVGGVVATPHVTLPPTDQTSPAAPATNDTRLPALLLIAGSVGLLLLLAPARRRSRG